MFTYTGSCNIRRCRGMLENLAIRNIRVPCPGSGAAGIQTDEVDYRRWLSTELQPIWRLYDSLNPRQISKRRKTYEPPRNYVTNKPRSMRISASSPYIAGFFRFVLLLTAFNTQGMIHTTKVEA